MIERKYSSWDLIAQLWCLPQHEKKTIDPTLAVDIVALLEEERRLADNWEETARQYSRNADYYKDLCCKIGVLLGDESFISDDGTVQENVLCAKLPKLVEKFMKEKRK